MSKHRKRADPDYGLECPRCGGKWVTYRRKTNTVYCRKCGTEWGADWIDPPKGKGVQR